jgi:hypothetical protein
MRCSVLPERTIRSSSRLSSGVTANAALVAHMSRHMTGANQFVKRYVRHYPSFSEPRLRTARLPPTKDRDIAMIRRFD